jgi:hypothetical protein
MAGSDGLRKKVEYVLRQKQDRPHSCHWPGCKAQCKPAFWGCRVHWYTLPADLRAKVWREYKPGQEVTMTPSREYLKAAELVQEWIAAYIQRKGKKK